MHIVEFVSVFFLIRRPFPFCIVLMWGAANFEKTYVAHTELLYFLISVVVIELPNCFGAFQHAATCS